MILLYLIQDNYNGILVPVGDVNKMFKLFPEDLIEYAMDEEGYDKDDLNDFKDDLEDQLQNNHDRMEEYYGDDCSLSYKIVDVEEN